MDGGFEWNSSLQNRRVVVLDTETTGLSATARIVELAALEVDPRSGRRGRELHWVVDPRVPIPEVVTRIHGIGANEVAGKPGFDQIAGELSGFLSGATVVAQNAGFDRRILDAELERVGHGPLAHLGVAVVDTVAVSRALFPLDARHNLDALCDRLGVDRSSRRQHGALLDARLLARALPRLALAYDAWCSSDDIAGDETFAEFDRQLYLLCAQAEALAEARTPEEAELAVLRIATEAASLRRWERAWLGRAEEEVPETGWCAKRLAARWTSSESTSWKWAARAFLDEQRLAEFRSATRVQVLRVRPNDDLEVRRPVSTVLERLCAMLASAPLAILLSATCAVREAGERLEAARQALRATLIALAEDGYALPYVTLSNELRKHTDYRAALRTYAPGADLSTFTVTYRSLRLRARNLSACEALFDSPGTSTASVPGARVA